MLQNTRGVVLRTIKYGETSLIVSIFTELFGVQSYLVQGVRKAGQNRAGLLQPTSILELEAYQQPQKNLQRLKSFHSAHLYSNVQHDVIKNCIALFSVEILLRLLPEHAPLPELFEFCNTYFQFLDESDNTSLANMPLYFMIQCGNILGFEFKGNYTQETPYLNIEDGGFSEHPPQTHPLISEEDARMIGALVVVPELPGIGIVKMNAGIRYRLIDWYLEFLHRHTQHFGQIKSLSVLRTILH